MPSDYLTRSRFLNRTSSEMLSWNYSNVQKNRTIVTINDWEQTTSRRNGFLSSDLSQSDVGGDFNHMKFTDTRESVDLNLHFGNRINGAYAYNYVGAFNCIRDSPSEASIRATMAAISMTQPALQVSGTRFYAEASPTAPKAGISTALYELKHEGLPGLSSSVIDGLGRTGPWKRRIKAPVKGSGADYLNWQFGWVPLISDVRALAKSAMEADSLLRSLYKDNGKVVRRRRGNPNFTRLEDQISTETASQYGVPTMVTSAYSSPSGGKLFTSTETLRSQWFSGAFMYYLPESVTSLGKLQSIMSDTRYLYGLSLSPIDVWNLIPFSWLVDWAFNVGDVLSNLSDQLFNRQVLKYGYVMAHTTRTTYVHGTYPLVGGLCAVPRAVSVYDVKQRVQATPFGFGLNWASFTPYQFSILAALGISRGR